MLDIVIGWKNVELEFNGETVSVDLRPLKTDEVLILAPLMESKPETLSRGFRLQKASKEIFCNSVKNIKGITVNGAEPTTDQICDESLLSLLSASILNKLIEMSAPKREEEKNSDGLSPSVQ